MKEFEILFSLPFEPSVAPRVATAGSYVVRRLILLAESCSDVFIHQSLRRRG